MNSNMLFVGSMAILAVLFITASLPFSEKGEKVFKRLSLRGWNYYRSMGFYYENISKSEYYETLKSEAEERISGMDFYDMGVSILKHGEDTSSNMSYYDEGFDCGKCQGELDALMMVYVLMDKGEG